MTIRELWEKYERENCSHFEETEREITLQKIAFAVGAGSVLGLVKRGVPVEDDFESLAKLIRECEPILG